MLKTFGAYIIPAGGDYTLVFVKGGDEMDARGALGVIYPDCTITTVYESEPKLKWEKTPKLIHHEHNKEVPPMGLGR